MRTTVVALLVISLVGLGLTYLGELGSPDDYSPSASSPTTTSPLDAELRAPTLATTPYPGPVPPDRFPHPVPVPLDGLPYPGPLSPYQLGSTPSTPAEAPITLQPTVAPPPPLPTPDRRVRVASHTFYTVTVTGPLDPAPLRVYYVVVGEIVNDTNAPIYGVAVGANSKESNAQVSAVGGDPVILGEVRAGHKSPFRTLANAVPTSLLFQGMRVSRYQTTPPLSSGRGITGVRAIFYHDFAIADERAFWDGKSYVVEADIGNNTPYTWHAVDPAVTLYDGSGRVIDVGSPYLPVDLLPGAKTRFGVRFEGAHVEAVSSYAISVEGRR